MTTSVPRNGGHVVIDAFARAGTNAVFAIHGVQSEAIFQAAVDGGLRLVDVRHEASAGFAAEAASRVSGTVGLAVVCPGPGFTNVLTSVTNAAVDRTPVVYVVGSPPDAAHESNGLQVGIDHLALAAPVAKWTARVSKPDQLARLVAQAIRVATTAPCGPVVLDIPVDVLDADAVDLAVPASVSTSPAGLAAEAIENCLDRLASSVRPALIVGHTASALGRGAARALAETTGIPCFTNFGSIGTLDDSHPAYGGTLYQLARLPVDARPDVVIAVGTTFGYDTPGLRDGGVRWGVEMIQIDADPREAGRLGGSIAISADPDAALAQLAASAARRQWPATTAWTGSVRSARDSMFTRLEADAASWTATSPEAQSRMHPYAAARSVGDAAASSRSVLIGDGAVCKHWLHDAMRLPEGARYLTHGRFGCMGTGPGMAIGAAVASGQPVICVLGDGAAGFALGEFEAAVRHQLPVTFVVFNNARWGASAGYQMRPGGRQRHVGTLLSDTAYHDVMAALGGHGVRVASTSDLDAALLAASSSKVPTCINVAVTADGLAPEIPLLNNEPA